VTAAALATGVNQLAADRLCRRTRSPAIHASRLARHRPELEHESTLDEAGKARQVKTALKAVAFGAIAERLATQSMGSLWRFQGFLATPGNGKHPVLHIQDFQQD
jgi:primosomal replication protein N